MAVFTRRHILLPGRGVAAALVTISIGGILTFCLTAGFLIIPSKQNDERISFENALLKATNSAKIDFSDLEKALPGVIFKTRSHNRTNGRCKQPAGRRILINYASNCCKHSQLKNCETGLAVGGFDVCIMLNETAIDEDFRRQNKRIFTVKRGSGLWLWKPYIIMKTLNAMHDDDVLFYSDAGSHFVANVDMSLICLQEQLGMDIILFSLPFKEKFYTKADAFTLMNVNASDPVMADTQQASASFVLLRKTFRSMQFVGQWLTYAQDDRIISGGHSRFAANPSGFKGHRHDQSILSLLSKKLNLELLPDPTQWGEYTEPMKVRKQERYRLINKTFIHHSRNKT